MRVPAVAILSMLVLSGCALPPIVTVASLAANGVSYATTGKSTTDHAISAIAGEDCALLRVASEDDICDPDGDILIALEGATNDGQDWYFDPETGSHGAFSAPPADASASQLAALAPVAAPAPRRIVEPTPRMAIAPIIRGRFVNARPSPKPDAPQMRAAAVMPEPQVAEQPVGWLQRLTGNRHNLPDNTAP